MRVVICLEASHQRGMGHLFRSLNLGRALHDHGHAVTLVLNSDSRSQALVEATHFPMVIVEDFDDAREWEGELLRELEPDCWINDRLDTTRRHAEAVLAHGSRLITFDDHGTGAQLARFNVLAMDPAPSTRPANALCGPDFMILPPALERYVRPARVGSVPHRLLLTFGGSDTYGVTPRVLHALSEVKAPLAIRAVVGPNFRHYEEMRTAAAAHEGRLEILQSVPDLLLLMAEADAILCGGGVTLFEAAALGRPTLSVANEPHEMPVIQHFEAHGATRGLGLHTEDFEARLAVELSSLLNAPDRVERMQASAKALVDGQGLQRVVDRIEAL